MATFEERLRQWQQPPPPASPNPSPSSLPLPLPTAPAPSLRSSPSSITSADDDASSDHTISTHLEPIRTVPSRPRSQFQYEFFDDDEEAENGEKLPPTGIFGPARAQLNCFWRNHISVVVPGADARDHLALERTYLSYHRTSLALALLAVIVAQLQILQHSPNPDPVFGFYALGKPLAVGLIVCAISISLLGWVRWWHWQRTLLRGKALAGGPELAAVGGIGALVIVAFLGMVAAVDIRKSYFTRHDDT
ncbi:hypothetical protein BZA05DRAFT_405676 [Tricharina praecox]|uniref:uncharacterized protein n=1 Tax=Tricharina praecox TaxID=43433 RepID=UPI00221FC8E5|nr:uncharacterized protein BZA05DRAFT_405676 [Tricharina praecox]KAI5846859.1 hypothetical protein BZA05DRAFT_405676 [Tricharina praecox]